MSWYVLYHRRGVLLCTPTLSGGVGQQAGRFTPPYSVGLLADERDRRGLGVFIAGFSSIFDRPAEFHRHDPKMRAPGMTLVPAAGSYLGRCYATSLIVSSSELRSLRSRCSCWALKRILHVGIFSIPPWVGDSPAVSASVSGSTRTQRSTS